MSVDTISPATHALSVGIVGAGDIARAHLAVLLNLPNVTVAWITDVDAQRARAVADAYRIPSQILPGDLTQLPRADVVLLCIPYGAREPFYAALSRLGAAVYAEKPLALTVGEHRRLCALFAPERLACGFQLRSSSRVQLVKSLIALQLFGPLRRVRFGHGGPTLQIGGKASSNIRLSGGGPLFEVAVHGLDATLYCTGATRFSLQHVRMEMDDGFDLHTEATASLALPDGTNVDWDITVSSLVPTIAGLECEFERATTFFSLNDQAPGIVVRQGAEEYRLSAEPSGRLPATSHQTFYVYWRTFLEGVCQGRANYTAAAHSEMTTAVIEALYHHGRGQAVPC